MSVNVKPLALQSEAVKPDGCVAMTVGSICGIVEGTEGAAGFVSRFCGISGIDPPINLHAGMNNNNTTIRKNNLELVFILSLA